MRLGALRLERPGAQLRLEVPVTTTAGTETWWCAVDAADLPAPATTVAPFLPLAALLAAALGEDLEVEDPVDPVQLDGVARAAARYQSWWGWRPPVIDAGTAAAATDRSSTRALLFTRGIDSSAELASAVLGEGPAVDVVVHVAGIDPFRSPATAHRQRERTVAVAAELGVPAVVVTTNLRDVADRVVSWDRSHGAVVAGAALVLGAPVGTVVLSQAVSAATERVRNRPYGVHRDLIADWSTSATAVVGGDAERDRVDKVAVVLRVPALAAAFHVCWEADVDGNCGRCEKCLGTATALCVLGRADVVAERFDAPFRTGRIRRVHRPDPTRPGALDEVIGRLRAAVAAGDTDLAELLDAWDDHTSTSGNGAQAGLAGWDTARLARALGPEPEGRAVVVERPLGWGADAVPVHLPLAARAAVLADGPGRPDAIARPLPWCQVDRLAPFAARVAAELSEARPGGSVLLVERHSPTAPPHAVRRLLRTARVRCWASDAAHLEAVPLLEALLAGCVPVQIAADVDEARAQLPAWAHALVRDVAGAAALLDDDSDLARTWDAAVTLAVGGSLERDAVVSFTEVLW